jgi:hypothetical protein
VGRVLRPSQDWHKSKNLPGKAAAGPGAKKIGNVDCARSRLMALTFRNTQLLGADRFTAFEGERIVGRIYKTREGDWFWGVDYLEADCTLVTDYAHTVEER